MCIIFDSLKCNLVHFDFCIFSLKNKFQKYQFLLIGDVTFNETIENKSRIMQVWPLCLHYSKTFLIFNFPRSNFHAGFLDKVTAQNLYSKSQLLLSGKNNKIERMVFLRVYFSKTIKYIRLRNNRTDLKQQHLLFFLQTQV